MMIKIDNYSKLFIDKQGEAVKPEELKLRRKLGIPDDAEKILIFGESTHWDPNWLLTSKEYYHLNVRWIISRVLKYLLKDPRRVYTWECTFFPKMYWERNRKKRNTIRALVNENRLRFSGTGHTTPDTLLPPLESILRDFQFGRQWIADNGMEAEPRIACLPDNFGNTPELPSILNALGIRHAVMSRIDGHYYGDADLRDKKEFPLPGSSAELMLKTHRTADLIWRASDGSEVLFHLNPYTYGQGDYLTSVGNFRWMDMNIGGYRKPSSSHVAMRIQSYIDDLGPYGKTPYLFCPIGGDFNGPIKNLGRHLYRYNSRYYHETGTYTVNAALEDYMDLVDFHRDKLPVVRLDPNPVFTAFYSARPNLKQEAKRLVEELVLADLLLAMGEEYPKTSPDFIKLKKGWEIAVMSNHHDYITGTSSNRVTNREQLPLIKKARKLAGEVLAAKMDLAPEKVNGNGSLPQYKMDRGRLFVKTSHYEITLDETAGGCITSWKDSSGSELLDGPGNDIVAYNDTGGLWRCGMEFLGGAFDEIAKTSDGPGEITVEAGDLLTVKVESILEEKRLTRLLYFDNDSPAVLMRVTGTAPVRRTHTCRFPTLLRPETITMDVAGGIAEDRPLEKIFSPTFWAAKSFAWVQDTGSETGMALFMGGPASPKCDSSGRMECAAIKNVLRETAFGSKKLLGFPVGGPDNQEQSLDYGVLFTGAGSWRDNRIHLMAEPLLDSPVFRSTRPSFRDTVGWFITIDDDEVSIIAVKPAERGGGIIVRLNGLVTSEKGVTLTVKDRSVRKAVLCDARERDLHDLEVRDGKALVPVARNTVSVRVVL